MYCRVSARVAQRYALDKIADDRLRVYVVWGPYKEEETVEDARQAAPFVPDPRATHFWTASLAPGDLFKESLQPLGLGPGSPWDSFLTFEAAAVWEEEPPVPVSLMHRNVAGKPMHGERLHALLGELLYDKSRTDGQPPARAPDLH